MRSCGSVLSDLCARKPAGVSIHPGAKSTALNFLNQTSSASELPASRYSGTPRPTVTRWTMRNMGPEPVQIVDDLAILSLRPGVSNS